MVAFIVIFYTKNLRTLNIDKKKFVSLKNFTLTNFFDGLQLLRKFNNYLSSRLLPIKLHFVCFLGQSLHG